MRCKSLFCPHLQCSLEDKHKGMHGNSGMNWDIQAHYANESDLARAMAPVVLEPNPYSHYVKDVRGLNKLDVYRVLELFEVKSPAIQHAIKKLLAAGGRGAKDTKKDVAEAIVSLKRWEEMYSEDES